MHLPRIVAASAASRLLLSESSERWSSRPRTSAPWSGTQRLPGGSASVGVMTSTLFVGDVMALASWLRERVSQQLVDVPPDRTVLRHPGVARDNLGERERHGYALQAFDLGG